MPEINMKKYLTIALSLSVTVLSFYFIIFWIVTTTGSYKIAKRTAIEIIAADNNLHGDFYASPFGYSIESRGSNGTATYTFIVYTTSNQIGQIYVDLEKHHDNWKPSKCSVTYEDTTLEPIYEIHCMSLIYKNR